MSVLRRSLGVGAVALALVGALLCVSGVAAAWKLRCIVGDVADGVFDTADDALRAIDVRLARVETAFKSGAVRLELLVKAVERLRPEQSPARAEIAALVKALDEEIAARLAKAQEWLDSSGDVAMNVGKAAQSVLSSKYAATHEDAVGVAIARQVHEFSERTVEILASLQEAKDDLAAMRDDVNLARTLVPRLVARLGQAETRLSGTVERITKLRTRLAETKQAVADLSRRFQRWTTLAAMAIAALIAWFGVSQVVMIRHGWRLVWR
jgi:hypothetical protein